MCNAALRGAYSMGSAVLAGPVLRRVAEFSTARGNVCNIGTGATNCTDVMSLPDDPWSVLLRAALGGDSVAYARFLRDVTPVLRGVVHAKGRSLTREHQEDIVQEVLLAVHRKRHTWQPDLPVRPWLFAIARHKVVDAFRAGGTVVNLPIDAFEDDLVAEAAPDGLAGRDVARLMARLDRRSAEIVRAVELDEEGTTAVGARLGMTEGAVRVALHRAIKRLSAMARGAQP